MKIKEVLARTGLTDRAVRLYISEDLICPQNRQSYTGRKNLDFSEEDIRQLQQIAVLRKAEFSIEQIRLLKQDSRTAAQVLQGMYWKSAGGWMRAGESSALWRRFPRSKRSPWS